MTSVLVVEDSARIGAFVEKGLRAQGFATRWVKTGSEGLTEALTGAHDLVVLDLGLPDLDGSDLLRALRAAGRTVPVIILTARDSVVDRVAGLSGGADDYLAKPFAFEELLARIRLRLRETRKPNPRCSGPETSRSISVRAGYPSRGRKKTSPPASSPCWRRCCVTGVRCYRGNNCSAVSGGSTSIPARTWWTSTSGICVARSAPTGSKPCAVWDTGSVGRHETVLIRRSQSSPFQAEQWFP